MAKPNAKAPLGQGGRFAALAAYIGRKKLGATKMAKLSAKGRRGK